MIRWRFLLTRTLVIVAILMLLRWGLGPLARVLTVQGLQAATGARVEIAGTELGLFPPRVRYTDFRIADPREGKADRDLLRAATVELVIDGDALLHRRWVARNGRLTGLELGARRDTSGHFDEADTGEPEEATGPSLLGRLVGGAADRWGDQAETLVADLETVRRSRQIRSRWEQDYAALAARASNLEKEIRAIRDQAKSIDNPLRDYPQLERTLARANEIRVELSQVREQIDSLPRKLQEDLAALEEAKQIDLAKIDAYVPGDLADSGELGSDLVAGPVREQLRQLRRYLEHGRTVANVTIVAPESSRVRGKTIDLLGDGRQPNLLVRRCELNGLLRSSGRVYALTGVVENLTPTPEQLSAPTRAKLLLEDAAVRAGKPIRVDYVADRRSEPPVDQLTFLWPRSSAAVRHFGEDERVGLSVEGGQREVWAQLRCAGESIEGRLVSKQTGLKLRLRVDPQYASSPIAVSLSESLSAVDRIEVDASFSGTWQQIDLDLETNLQRILRDATQDALADQLRESKQQLAARVRQEHLRQSDELRGWISSRQAEARNLLASADRSIEQMLHKVTRGLGSTEAYLGRFRSAVEGQLR